MLIAKPSIQRNIANSRPLCTVVLQALLARICLLTVGGMQAGKHGYCKINEVGRTLVDNACVRSSQMESFAHLVQAHLHVCNHLDISEFSPETAAK